MSQSMSKNIEAALVDLSGTLHVDDFAIPNAVESLERLRNSGIKLKFVTNTTNEPKRMLLERLVRLGFRVEREEIFTSLSAARCLVASRKLQPLLLLETTAMEDFEGIPQENPNAVVVGLAPSRLNYEQMNSAFQLILTGSPLIAIHKARYYKRSDGLALGPGPFVAGLEFAADVKAEVVGKPQSTFFMSALNEMGASAETSVMIGDDVRDDIGGAQAMGMRGILVKTGKYRVNDEEKIDPQPHHTCTDFSQAVDYILQHVS